MVVPGKPINKGFSAYLQLFKLDFDNLPYAEK